MKEKRKKLTGFNEEPRTLWEATPASNDNASLASGGNVNQKNIKKSFIQFFWLKHFLIISPRQKQRSIFCFFFVFKGGKTGKKTVIFTLCQIWIKKQLE